MLLQVACHAGDGRSLLADGHIDAQHILVLLVQDGVGCNGGLAGLAVADDQLTLTTADGEHGVDGQDAGVQRGVHALALQDAGGLLLDGVVALCLNGALAVDGLAQGADDAAQEAVAHRDAGAFAAAGHQSAHAHFLDLVKQHDAQMIGLHAFHHALCTVVKGDDLAVNGLIHALDIHNAVGCGDHGAALCGRGGGLVVLHTGLHHSQAGRIRRNGGQSALAGVVEHTAAHLQHIAGDQVRLHADGQLHLSGTVLLFQLGADALHGVLSRGTGTVQISL